MSVTIFHPPMSRAKTSVRILRQNSFVCIDHKNESMQKSVLKNTEAGIKF